MSLTSFQDKRKLAAVGAATTFVIGLMLAVPMVVGNQAAYAAANKSISGSGTGDITCLNGPLPVSKPATINFQASKSKGIMQGFFQITSAGTFKSGSISGGSIGDNSFTLTGSETFDTACGGPVPISFTIQGECGTGATITFESATQRGEFVGNVAC